MLDIQKNVDGRTKVLYNYNIATLADCMPCRKKPRNHFQKKKNRKGRAIGILMITCIKLFFKRGLTDVTPFDILHVINR